MIRMVRVVLWLPVLFAVAVNVAHMLEFGLRVLLSGPARRCAVESRLSVAVLLADAE